MDEEIERLVIGVRADTGQFQRDMDSMRATMEGPFAAGAERAGRAVENALIRAARTGKIGFDDLKSVALAALNEIAASAIRGGIQSLFGTGGGGGAVPDGGGLLSGLIGLLGAPGRATGGPVSPNRPYWVGERGPELFVPTAAGQVSAGGNGGGARDVRVAITINAPADTAPASLRQSGRQVARAVRAALTEQD